ncbi:hypothetical protein GJU94_08160 [Brucella sp. 10RB9214]|uniref:hypothetical protein n=1 Tax=Brucella sp. 10RB9214 TaxID=1844040 RepID=UPI0012AD5DAC|nr:hypothetical protein [Brucella sp. 10RB9214]MRN49806.1 hypothetical protein [Brucella sp. 10RB9214]
MASDVQNDVSSQKARADRVWQERSGWDEIYREAWDYAIPQRKPGGRGKSKRLAMKIYDMTATTSIMHGAGQLVRQLFGSTPFIMEPGPLLEARLPANQLKVLRQEFAMMQRNVYWPIDWRVAFVIALGAALAKPVSEDGDLEQTLRVEAFGTPSQEGTGGAFGRLIAQDRAAAPMPRSPWSDDPLTSARWG